jgi:hypothetical protein
VGRELAERGRERISHDQRPDALLVRDSGTAGSCSLVEGPEDVTRLMPAACSYARAPYQCDLSSFIETAVSRADGNPDACLRVMRRNATAGPRLKPAPRPGMTARCSCPSPLSCGSSSSTAVGMPADLPVKISTALPAGARFLSSLDLQPSEQALVLHLHDMTLKCDVGWRPRSDRIWSEYHCRKVGVCARRRPLWPWRSFWRCMPE